MSPTARRGTADRTLAPCFWSVDTQIGALQRGELSATELLQACQTQALRHDPQLAAFLATDWPAAFDLAGQHHSDSAGLLAGIPYALKDNIDVQGWHTTCHSARRRTVKADQDSDVAARLRQAGGILVGKNSLHELATGGPALDLPWPPARNPWNPALHPGGSSSGSAVAVATGMASFSVGTDTGGSVRHPASVCGIFGYKPTFDVIAMTGVVPLSPTCDHMGVLCRSSYDVPHLMAALAADPQLAADFQALAHATRPTALKGMRIGVIDAFSANLDADPRLQAALDALIQALTREGAVITTVRTPPLARYLACSKVVVYADAYRCHGAQIDAAPDQFCERTRQKVGAGRSISTEQYAAALQEKAVLTAELNHAMADVDVAISLSSLGFACRIDDKAAILQTYDSQQARIPFSLTGLPSASVPVGVSDHGLPIGLLVSAKSGDDVLLTKVMMAMEAADTCRYQVAPAVF